MASLSGGGRRGKPLIEALTGAPPPNKHFSSFTACLHTRVSLPQSSSGSLIYDPCLSLNFSSTPAAGEAEEEEEGRAASENEGATRASKAKY